MDEGRAGRKLPLDAPLAASSLAILAFAGLVARKNVEKA
jgi:hypothetical protein